MTSSITLRIKKGKLIIIKPTPPAKEMYNNLFKDKKRKKKNEL